MKIGVILLLAAAMVFSAPPAFADPIVITRGFVTIGSFFESNHPPFGFQLSGDGTDIGGVTFDQGSPIVRIGQTVDLSRTVPVTSLVFGPFEQTVQGVRYNDVVIQGSLARRVTFFNSLLVLLRHRIGVASAVLRGALQLDIARGCWRGP